MHNTSTLFGLKPELMHVGSPGMVTKVYPYPGYCATSSLTEVTQVPG